MNILFKSDTWKKNSLRTQFSCWLHCFQMKSSLWGQIWDRQDFLWVNRRVTSVFRRRESHNITIRDTAESTTESDTMSDTQKRFHPKLVLALKETLKSVNLGCKTVSASVSEGWQWWKGHWRVNRERKRRRRRGALQQTYKTQELVKMNVHPQWHTLIVILRAWH